MTRLDYYKVEPHKIALLGKNFTSANRGKGQIKYITRHHTAGILDAAALNRVWHDRPASTHYLADQHGIISQHVWDRHIAWSNGNAASNAVTLTIEHSNNGGSSADWPISQATIIAGARWAAALCLYYGLGRPVFGKNIRDHREFTGTSCPHHLAHGGKYHQQWMDEAQSFYDKLVNKSVNKDGTPKAGSTKAPAPTKGNEVSFTEEDRQMLRRVHHELTHDFQSRYPGSTFRDTLVGYVLELDRKVEDMHANMAPSVWKKLGEIADYLAKK